MPPGDWNGRNVRRRRKLQQSHGAMTAYMP